jgi:TRAP-type C4-dicarboxylate transport system permease small subunit
MTKKYTLESWVCAAILVLITVVLFAEVILRRVFGTSLIWSEEASRYLFIWFVFISSSYAITDGSHIRIEAMIRLVPQRMRRVVTQIGLLLWIVFSCAMVYYTLDYAIVTLLRGTMTVASHIPLGIVLIGIPLGFLLSIWRLVQTFIRNLRPGGPLEQEVSP